MRDEDTLDLVSDAVLRVILELREALHVAKRLQKWMLRMRTVTSSGGIWGGDKKLSSRWH